MTGCLFQAACPLALGETRAAQGPAQRCPAVPRGPSGADPSPVASTAPAVWPCTALASSARSWSSPPAWRSSQSHLPQVSCRPRARRGPDAPVCYRGGCSGFAGAASVFDSCQSVLIGQFVFNDLCQPAGMLCPLSRSWIWQYAKCGAQRRKRTPRLCWRQGCLEGTFLTDCAAQVSHMRPHSAVEAIQRVKSRLRMTMLVATAHRISTIAKGRVCSVLPHCDLHVMYSCAIRSGHVGRLECLECL